MRYKNHFPTLLRKLYSSLLYTKWGEVSKEELRKELIFTRNVAIAALEAIQDHVDLSPEDRAYSLSFMDLNQLEHGANKDE